MQEVKIETRQTTTTTTTTTNGSAVNIMYFKSLPGILKFLEVFFGIIAIALASDSLFGVTHFFLFICWASMIITILWIVIIFFRMNERISLKFSWVQIELWCTIGILLFYFLVMVLQFTKLSGHYSHRGSTYVERHTAAAVFALFNTVAYAVSAFLLFMQMRT